MADVGVALSPPDLRRARQAALEAVRTANAVLETARGSGPDAAVGDAIRVLLSNVTGCINETIKAVIVELVAARDELGPLQKIDGEAHASALELAIAESRRVMMAASPRRETDFGYRVIVGFDPETVATVRPTLAEATPLDWQFLKREIDQEVRRAATRRIRSGTVIADATPELDEDAMLTAATLATRFGLRHEAFRKRLERWRKKNAAGDGWTESEDGQFLYRYGHVRTLVEAARASASRPDGNPSP